MYPYSVFKYKLDRCMQLMMHQNFKINKLSGKDNLHMFLHSFVEKFIHIVTTSH